MSTPTTTDDVAAIETLMSLGHNPRNYDQPVLPVRHPSSSTLPPRTTYASTSRSLSGLSPLSYASASSPYGPLIGLPDSIASSSTTTSITASSSSRSCSLPSISSVPPVSNTNPRYLQSGGSGRAIPGSRLNERRGLGRLSGPGSRDILELRGGGVGDGVDGLRDSRSGEAGDGSGDGENHRCTISPEPGFDIEDEADVRTIRGFGRPDEDDISSTRIGIGDVKRYDIDDHNGGDDDRGGVDKNGRNTGIRDMIRVEGEDLHLHLRPRSDMDMEVDLGMGMDGDRDMLMRMDPDMVGILKSIYGWGDREVSPHSSLFSTLLFSAGRARIRAGGSQREANDYQTDLPASCSSFTLPL
jgi:hypothetical protein